MENNIIPENQKNKYTVCMHHHHHHYYQETYVWMHVYMYGSTWEDVGQAEKRSERIEDAAEELNFDPSVRKKV